MYAPRDNHSLQTVSSNRCKLIKQIVSPTYPTSVLYTTNVYDRETTSFICMPAASYESRYVHLHSRASRLTI